MTAPENNSPIFIVGSSRSGTSLLAAMLSAHSRIACGPETQLLHKIKKAQLEEALADSDWPQLAVKHLSKLTLAGQRVIDIYKLSEELLTEYLRDKPQSIASIFESITANFARAQNKPRWAEKTPRHLLHVETIRREFPNAKIIRIVRDPRDSAISMRQLNWSSNDYLPNLYIWNEWYDKTDAFFETETNSTTIQYEDLAHSPQETLVSLCKFIGEDFEIGMLQTSDSGKLVATANEPWKQQVSEDIDTSRCYRWKKELSTIEKTTSIYLVNKWLTKFNYETTTQQPEILPTDHLNTQLIEQNRDLILSLASHGYLIRKTNRPLLEEPILLIFLTPKRVETKRQRKDIHQLLRSRAIKFKKTILLLNPETKLKRKDRLLLHLMSYRLRLLPIDLSKTLRELGLRKIKDHPSP